MNNKFLFISIFVIILVNIAIYGKTANYDFVNFDDSDYVIENPFIKKLDKNDVKDIFTKFYFSNYQPLVHLSYALEYKSFKSNAGGYHITNTVLHTINGILVLLLIYLITKNVWISLIIALLFSLHPMQVESVAWISERKGIMCAFFYFLSFMAYIRFSRQDKKGFYYLSAVLFLLALLSKPMAVTFPIILLLFDYYEEKISRSKFIEKIPFFALSGIFSIITVFAQRSGGAIDIRKGKLVLKNFLLVFYNIGFYISKLLIPIKLSASYEYPLGVEYASPIKIIISIFIIAVIALYLINFKKIRREINFGILFFFVSLVPILRLVPLGSTFAADRYMYIPMIGFFFAIAMLISPLIAGSPGIKKASVVIIGAYILILSGLAYARCEVWRNGYNLWSNVLKVNSNSVLARRGLGEIYMQKRDFKKAKEHFFFLLNNKVAVESALFGLGKISLHENNLEDAKKHFTLLVEDFPYTKPWEKARAYMYLGNIYDMTGEFEKAAGLYEQSLGLNSQDSFIHYNYAMALEHNGKLKEAAKYYKLAVKFDKKNWDLPKKALIRMGIR
jgi:tetratricopeptide (TPR) repeat protein